MKKLLFLIAIVCVTSLSASAQFYPSAKFNIGIDGGVPLGTVSNYYSGTAGISFQYQFPLGLSPVNVVLSTGYMGYFTDSGYGGYYDGGYGGGAYYSGDVASFIPVEAGLKFYFNRHIFIEGDAGVSFNINSNTSYYTGSETAFIYAPSVGYAMPVGFSKTSVELSLRYESRLETDWGYNQLALRAAFCFGGK
jgi:hypothetical protein